MDTEGMELDIIVNPKTTDDGQAVIQLETAAGAAIKHFNNAHGVNVPRSRFLPVKSCSDLLLIKSDIYSLQHGQLVINPQRMFETTPVIKLGDHFKKIQQFQKRFKKIPKIIELDHLTVTGDVYFGRNVTLRGTVIVVANEGQRIDIPDGCVLENRLLSGNLNMIVCLRAVIILSLSDIVSSFHRSYERGMLATRWRRTCCSPSTLPFPLHITDDGRLPYNTRYVPQAPSPARKFATMHDLRSRLTILVFLSRYDRPS